MKTRTRAQVPKQDKPSVEAHVDLMGALKRSLQEQTGGSAAWDEAAKIILASAEFSGSGQLTFSSPDIDIILDRIDQSLAAERAAMDRLIERMVSRTPR
jgi:hypothetical protein